MIYKYAIQIRTGAAGLYHKEVVLAAMPATGFSSSSRRLVAASGGCFIFGLWDERSGWTLSGTRASPFFPLLPLLGGRRNASQSKPAATLTLRLSTKLLRSPRRPSMLSLKSDFFKSVLRSPSPSLPSIRIQGCL